MTNEEIIKKALEKANWFPSDRAEKQVVDNPIWMRGVIFSHDFAKEFWGDLPEVLHTVEHPWDEGKFGSDEHIPYWEYQLMEMVRQPEPLKYLEKFL
jgi:hypothetical protein